MRQICMIVILSIIVIAISGCAEKVAPAGTVIPEDKLFPESGVISDEKAFPEDGTMKSDEGEFNADPFPYPEEKKPASASSSAAGASTGSASGTGSTNGVSSSSDSSSSSASSPSASSTSASNSSADAKKKLDKMGLWRSGALRGANIYQRIIYPDVYDDTSVWGDGPIGPVFTQADFDALSKAGANLVIISHPGFLDDQQPYSFNKAVQDNLDNLISMAEKADLFVVISFRTGPGRSEFTFFGVTPDDSFGMSHLNEAVWDNFVPQSKWQDMWRMAAQRYKDSPVVVGYELMVEPDANGFLDKYEPDDFYPAYDGTTNDWNQMSQKISMAIRSVDSETPILISSLSWGNVRWLPYLSYSDNHTVYTVHQYAPQQEYTHQCDTIKGCDLKNTYPGEFDTNGDSTEDTFDKSWLEAYLSPIPDFKRGKTVPVAVTEFGVERWEPGASKYVSDEMDIFDMMQVSYAVWSWQPMDPDYTDAHNNFNFRLGPRPDDLTEIDSALYVAYKDHWKENTERPSMYG